VIFIDSNVPMYVVGADHPNKRLARDLVARAALDDETLVTDAEVLQEILHRYVSIRRHDAIGPAMEAVLSMVDRVFPMEVADVELAAGIVHGTRVSARDAVHVAVMRRRGIDRIMTFDRGFDQVEGITRIPA
jgi:uncharacterized protein